MKCYKKQIFACPSINTVEYSRISVLSVTKNYRKREREREKERERERERERARIYKVDKQRLFLIMIGDIR